MSTMKFQIGKNGITDGVLESLVLAFNNHKQVRVHALKSSRRQDIEDVAEIIGRKLEEKTGFAYNSRILGFTIILNKVKKVDK